MESSGQLKFQPKAAQVKQSLEEELRQGVYPAGTRLPTALQLAKRYGVSNNVVLKAARLLVDDGLVTVRVGTGIISRTNGGASVAAAPDLGAAFHTGARKKELQVWVEDYEPWQQRFWRRFFRDFARQHPDITPRVCWGPEAKTAKAPADLVIGGTVYFSSLGHAVGDLFDLEALRAFDFGPATPRVVDWPDLEWAHRHPFLPIGFQVPLIYLRRTHDQRPSPEDRNILDFVRRVRRASGQPVRHYMMGVFAALVDMGCTYLNPREGRIEFGDPAHWRETLRQLREHWASGDLLTGDLTTDRNTFIRDGLGPVAATMEGPVQSLAAFKPEDGIEVVPYPVDRVAPVSIVAGWISRASAYPEECLRVLGALRAPEVQTELAQRHLMLPLDENVLTQAGYGDLARRLQRCAKHLIIPPDPLLARAVEEIMNWELRFHISGRTDGDVMDVLHRKLAFFLGRTAPEKLWPRP
ncbi:MAG: hypothetical protein A3K19_03565 [Lentisphaerae bacterium RIFOXYB12_FULL_65_16]|nr:MAG: hypothetical protein A3K18_30145 [Lentisphaerae bacterium RIFOXYA12_64_32]OGV86592.1 MAG: hypothetical protein A3K19_03565 [Lentisphaerae bacterium RIFOXYB12_FULL_65_16]